MSIKKVSQDAKIAKEKITNAKNYYTRAEASCGWKGEASEAFRNLDRRVMNRVSGLINGYSRLGTKLDSLENAVKRAESEEARKAARLK